MSEVRQAAEVRYAHELAALEAADTAARPAGWRLSPRAVETYVMGAETPVGGVVITPKYIGDRALIQVAIATLASDRALMLVGEPGTAKSWLSEHIAAAVSGTSTLIVQGTAGTSEEHVKYSWNYALLLAEGPSERSLLPSPIHRAMKSGRIVRFEEITRAAAEVQDGLISILSEKQMAVPELDEIVTAQRGFNLIGTANTRDRGVNEMSSALKRRFNFVTVPVIDDLDLEIDIVTRRAADLRNDHGIAVEPPAELTRMLVTVFQELRAGLTRDRRTKVRPLNGALSTAEAISVMFDSAILAQHFGSGHVSVDELSRSLLGSVTRDDADNIKIVREYCETVMKPRDGAWRDFYRAVTARLPD